MTAFVFLGGSNNKNWLLLRSRDENLSIATNEQNLRLIRKQCAIFTESSVCVEYRVPNMNFVSILFVGRIDPFNEIKDSDKRDVCRKGNSNMKCACSQQKIAHSTKETEK